MKSKVGIALVVIGLVCIIGAAVILLFNNYQDRNAGKASEDILEVMEDLIPDGNGESEDCNGELDPAREMAVINWNGYDYIGSLSIPSIGLKLPVMSEWDYDRLKIAPCRYSGSVFTNDLVIAGHNYKRHFGALRNLTQGTAVYFTDAEGTSTSYLVGGIEVLEPNQIQEMKESEWDLTLYTCTLGGASRVTVRCARVG